MRSVLITLIAVTMASKACVTDLHLKPPACHRAETISRLCSAASEATAGSFAAVLTSR
jgi:hypothetical protein